MSLKELDIKSCYETDEETSTLINEFYNPVLETAQRYYRIAGFFSSTSLVVASKGIEGLVNNGGKMYLLVSPELSEDDYRTLQTYQKLMPDMNIFSEIANEDLAHENLRLMAWLLNEGKLEIKVVVGKRSRNSLFHEKVGIITDGDNNMISFSGSINETAQAWLNNIEEFKVFKSWENGQMEYLEKDLSKFLSYWKNEKKEIANVYDIPQAIKDKIIKAKPNDIYELSLMRKYCKDNKNDCNSLSLFPHQKKALNKWRDNNYKLLMEMATGTGKTRTAIGCVVELLSKLKRLVIIIATPQITLSQQWLDDFEELKIKTDASLLVPGTLSAKKWRKNLELTLMDVAEGNIDSCVVFTTHVTASSSDFINIIKNNKYDIPYLFICDEVHAIGSKEQKKAMLDIYENRIGLSATPERMFDELGSEQIRSYFGGESFEFTISEALKTINEKTGLPFLNPFIYHPIFVELTDEEMNEYNKITKQIIILKQKDDFDPEDLQKLYERRAKIGRNAENKFAAFEELLEQLGPQKIKNTILFVSDKQIHDCFDILSSKKIKRAKITENESANKIINEDGESERKAILNQFKQGHLQMLVGEKCLDEGIDIKNAQIAILMSNSTNPREYIQRVGRVIRSMPGKEMSVIYDFVVTPPDGYDKNCGILEREANRSSQIAMNAENYGDVKKMFIERGINIDANQQ